MIGWLNPGALWGLSLLAVPVIVHLLSTTAVRRVPFPTLRFVQPSSASALRPRRPSDLLLLAVRLGVVAAGILAAAAPLFLTAGRLSAWNARVARAIVVDRSESMSAAGPDGRTAAQDAEAAAAAERRDAAWSIEIAAADAGEGIGRAAAWLARIPPARQEVVVISDFQHGALPEETFARLPGQIGLRLVKVGQSSTLRKIAGPPLLGASGIPTRTQAVELSEQGTRVSLSAAGPPTLEGLRLVPARGREIDRLLRVAASAGTARPSPEHPLALYFGGVPTDRPVAPVRTRWMVEAALRAREDGVLAEIARHAPHDGLPDAAARTTIARNARGEVLARASAADGELIVEVAGPPDTLFAAAILRAVLNARFGPTQQSEQEPIGEPADRLEALNRPAAGIGRETWRHAESSDARWFWAAALALLAIEGTLRSRPVSTHRKGEPRVAA